MIKYGAFRAIAYIYIFATIVQNNINHVYLD